MKEDSIFYEVTYISCEGNYRWTVVKCPESWSSDEVRSCLDLGSCGDEISRILSIELTGNSDYGIEFNDDDL